jgi:putative adenylate-forming enzyme
MQERLGDRSIEDWNTIEPISKKEMMAHFDSLNTVGISSTEALKIAKREEQNRQFQSKLDGYTVGLSSGTSGTLGLFLLSDREQEEWVGRILAKTLPEHLFWPKRDKVAFFLRADSPMYERTSSLRVQFQFFDLVDEIDAHISKLQILQPTILIAPPSFLRQLVPFIQNGSLSIHPNRVITVAEPLDAVDERLFRRVFGQTIHQVYQATEGFLATTCRYGTLHLNEELILFEREPLDPQRFVPIITDLFRTTQPIIRYRLDDILRLRPAPCSCGSILTPIDAIEGRCDDVLLLPKADGTLRPIYADFWRRTILMSDERIMDYGLRQHTPSTLELYIVADQEKEVRTKVEHSLNRFISKQGLIPVEIIHSTTFAKGGKQKKKRIERLWNTAE